MKKEWKISCPDCKNEDLEYLYILKNIKDKNNSVFCYKCKGFFWSNYKYEKIYNHHILAPDRMM